MTCCAVCQAWQPPKLSGRFCFNCRTILQGLEIEPLGPLVLKEDNEHSPLSFLVVNRGQTNITIHGFSVAIAHADPKPGSVDSSDPNPPFELSAGEEKQIKVIISSALDLAPLSKIVLWVETDVDISRKAEAQFDVVPFPSIDLKGVGLWESLPLISFSAPDRSSEKEPINPDLKFEGKCQLVVENLTNMELVFNPPNSKGVSYHILNDSDLMVPAEKKTFLEFDCFLEKPESLPDDGTRQLNDLQLETNWGLKITLPFYMRRLPWIDLRVETKDLIEQIKIVSVRGDSEEILAYDQNPALHTEIRIFNDSGIPLSVKGQITTTSPVVRIEQNMSFDDILIEENGLPLTLSILPNRSSFHEMEVEVEGQENQVEIRKFPIALNIPLNTIEGEPLDYLLRIMQIHVQNLDSYGQEIWAVDLGTTNTAFCALTPSGMMEDVYLEVGIHSYFPSLVQFKTRHSYDFGTHVKDAKSHNGDEFYSIAYLFKPRLESNKPRFKITPPRTGNSYQIEPREVTKIFLQYILGQFIRRRGMLPNRVMLSYPVDYSQETRDFMVETVEWILQQAGGNLESIFVDAELSEPAALLLDLISGDYGHLFQLDKPVIVGIFDFGGGTTDLLVSEVQFIGNEKICIHKSKYRYDEGGEKLTWILARTIWEFITQNWDLSAADENTATFQAMSQFNFTEDYLENPEGTQDAGFVYSSLIKQAELLKINLNTILDNAKQQSGRLPTFQGLFTLTEESNIENQLTEWCGILGGNADFLDLVIDVVDSFIDPMLRQLYSMVTNVTSRSQSNHEKAVICLSGNNSRMNRVEELATGNAMIEDDMTEDTMAEDTMAEDTMAEDTMTEDTMTEDTMTEDAMTEDATNKAIFPSVAFEVIPPYDETAKTGVVRGMLIMVRDNVVIVEDGLEQKNRVGFVSTLGNHIVKPEEPQEFPLVTNIAYIFESDSDDHIINPRKPYAFFNIPLRRLRKNKRDQFRILFLVENEEMVLQISSQNHPDCEERVVAKIL